MVTNESAWNSQKKQKQRNWNKVKWNAVQWSASHSIFHVTIHQCNLLDCYSFCRRKKMFFFYSFEKMHGISLSFYGECFEIRSFLKLNIGRRERKIRKLYEKVSFNVVAAAAAAMALNWIMVVLLANTWKSHHAMFYSVWEIVICFKKPFHQFQWQQQQQEQPQH